MKLEFGFGKLLVTSGEREEIEMEGGLQRGP